jgi:CheY-like chemotaxis protein
VIEDSKLLRAMIQRLLGKAGYSVVSAADGEEGLRIVRDQKPDLVLLDMLLPKLGGEEVLRNPDRWRPRGRVDKSLPEEPGEIAKGWSGCILGKRTLE